MRSLGTTHPVTAGMISSGRMCGRISICLEQQLQYIGLILSVMIAMLQLRQEMEIVAMISSISLQNKIAQMMLQKDLMIIG